MLVTGNDTRKGIDSRHNEGLSQQRFQGLTLLGPLISGKGGGRIVNFAKVKPFVSALLKPFPATPLISFRESGGAL